ncbi:hypothetical protein ACFV2Q_23580 [Streptomyces sp. NPDC059650]|uniref:hypothetical protein n=1 Tax=Streptomyces sp. NPDC059650 TaxID=3346896 RepID=UPI0036AB0AE7
MAYTQFPQLTAGSEARRAARDAMVEIIRGWAVVGRTDYYGELSRLMRESGFSVPPRGTLMSHLLKEVCLAEAARGVPVMLTAIVVNKRTERPSEQFEVLAKTEPFRRGEVPDWTWKTERDEVFKHYRQYGDH